MQLILWLVVLLAPTFSTTEVNNKRSNGDRLGKNNDTEALTLTALGHSVHPYAFRSKNMKNDKLKGPISVHLTHTLEVCFESKVSLEYTNVSNLSQDTESLMNDEQVVFPVRKQLQDLIAETGMSQDYKYIPVIESSGEHYYCILSIYLKYCW